MVVDATAMCAGCTLDAGNRKGKQKDRERNMKSESVSRYGTGDNIDDTDQFLGTCSP